MKHCNLSGMKPNASSYSGNAPAYDVQVLRAKPHLRKHFSPRCSPERALSSWHNRVLDRRAKGRDLGQRRVSASARRNSAQYRYLSRDVKERPYAHGPKKGGCAHLFVPELGFLDCRQGLKINRIIFLVGESLFGKRRVAEKYARARRRRGVERVWGR